jgi:cysteine-rich repeat protein
MRSRAMMLSGLLLLAVALPLGGCGDEDRRIAFTDCGNGVLDAGEECDDGNLDDDDDCLSTCRLATCGDGFLNRLREECDGTNFGGESCASLGLGGGSLACTASCTLDTSGCGGQPVPTATPAATATPTPDGGEPTATPTPDGGGATCQAGDRLTVTLSLDADYGGAVVTLDYPSAVVTFPGSGPIDPAQSQDVRFFPSGGFTTVLDADTDGDLADDRLTASFAGTSLVAAGPFVEFMFDCQAGMQAPGAGAFVCTVQSASDEQGNLLEGVDCTVAVAGP